VTRKMQRILDELALAEASRALQGREYSRIDRLHFVDPPSLDIAGINYDELLVERRQKGSRP
jgi:hypothetical protein